MNGSIPADATEIAHRRGERYGGSGGLPSPGVSRAGARQYSTAPWCPPPAGPARGTATQPHRRLPTPRRWAEHYRRNACDTETNSGADTQASKARQAGTSRRARIAAAKLRELAAEARAGRDAATLERLIVKGLTRYHHGLDNEERTALAATGLPLTGTSGTR